MAIREKLQENAAIATGGAGLALIIVAVLAWRSLAGPATPATAVTQTTFTVDDGKSYFADTDDRLAPFDKDGKEAVRVVFYTCDNGKTKFPGYLLRIKPTAKAEIEKQRQSGKDIGVSDLIQRNTEIKEPGGTQWVPINSPAGSKIRAVRPPAGQTGEPRVAGL